MPDKISILKESGETINSNVVSVFMIPDTEKKYIITTENAVDPHGLTVLHVSEIVDGTLQKIATDEEWSSIKTIMRAMISGNVSSYQYFQTIDSIKANGQYSRDISVSASASKQMIDNYMAAEKSNVVATPQSTNQANQPVGVNAPNPGVPPVPPAAIFPTNNAPAMNADDELIPGIAEVSATPVDSSVLTNDSLGNNVIAPSNLANVPPVVNNNQVGEMNGVVAPNMMNPNPVITPVNPVPNTMVPNVPMQPGIVTPNIIPESNQIPGIVPPVVSPAIPDNNLTNEMSNEVQVPNIPGMPPLTDNVNTMTASNVQVNNGILTPPPIQIQTPVVVTTEPEAKAPDVNLMPEVPLNPNVQVLQPSVIVPTAQIANEAQTSMPTAEVKINTNVTPSFAPDASLDEVVMAAQDMFMEGVKNLVQTIQEKVYRDIYAREAQVKEKEALLEQREKMLNDQMMAMMSNFAALQGKALTPSIGTDLNNNTK